MNALYFHFLNLKRRHRTCSSAVEYLTVLKSLKFRTRIKVIFNIVVTIQN